LSIRNCRLVSLDMATVETAGQVNIWNVTGTSLTGLTPLGTVTISGVSAATSIAASMGYLIIGSEDGITIIDPHDGSWAERTVGWPRSLSTSTTPALGSNATDDVTAFLLPNSPYDPRTGGKMPTFFVSNSSTTNAILNADGVPTNADVTSHAVAAGANTFAISRDTSRQLRIDNYSKLETGVIGGLEIAYASGPAAGMHLIANQNANAVDIGPGRAGALIAHGQTSGLNLIEQPALVDGELNGSIAHINRTYNTGYMAGDIRGAWLANSETADRSYKGNTLTKTTVGAGSITEVSADGGGGELKAYRFQSVAGATISYLKSSAADTDYDFGTADFSVMFWAHLPNVSTDNYLWSNGYSSGGYTGGGEIAIEQNADESVSLICSDDNFSTNDQATTGAGLLGADVWTHVCCYRDGSNIKVAVNGVIEATAALTNAAGSLTNTNSGRTMNIASSFALAYGISDGELALFRVSAGSISSTQIRQIYDCEKSMFTANARCLLQSGSTDAVLDVDVDPITGKVAVTQTDSQMIFDGLVVESTPAVDSGSSEHNILYGGDRFEINSDNLYATVAAKDLREDLEILRGLKAGLPAVVDLSKAKAWIKFDGSGTVAIKSSFNVKSLTDNGTGDYTVHFAIPFKSDSGFATITGSNGGSAHYHGFIVRHDNDGFTGQAIRLLHLEANTASTKRDTNGIYFAAFGELEKEKIVNE